MLLKNMSLHRPLIIGIAGGSGCGKTYLAREVQRSVGDGLVSVLSMDQYFRDVELATTDPSAINFDHPAHLDFDQMIRHIDALRDGQTVRIPSYDFAKMKRTDDAIAMAPRKVVIVEGLFVLAEPLASHCDLTCFLDVATDERLLGRILRDTRERGASIEQVIDRYQRYVRPSYQIFVSPTKQNADIVVDFTYRRAMFTKLLAHLITDSIHDEIDINAFVSDLRRESYAAGANLIAGYMPLATDILALARAYPESVVPLDPSRTRLVSPAMSSFESPKE